MTLADLLDHDPAELGLAGLEIDTDLRWRIVTALAAAGEIDADGPATPFIDAEVQRDPTAAGKRHAAQAAAARPQLPVKEQAWTTVVEDDTLANITARSMIAGIAQPGQHELLKPFTRATSRRSRACGHGDPAKWPRRWWSACIRPGTSATRASRRRTGSCRTPGAGGAAAAGARGPGRGEACAAGASLRRDS